MEVKIYNKFNEHIDYATEEAAGVDLRAKFDEEYIILKPLERKLIPTGNFIQMKPGYEAQVRPRSGLALKRGFSVLNTPGTIDSDYRGEICVVGINLSNEDIKIERDERIAQLVFKKYEKAFFNYVESIDKLDSSERGQNGLGHTGTK